MTYIKKLRANNSIVAVFSQLVKVGSGPLVLIVIGMTYSDQMLAKYYVLISLISIQQIFDSGVNYIAMRELALNNSQSESGKIKNKYTEINNFVILISILFIAANSVIYRDLLNFFDVLMLLIAVALNIKINLFHYLTEGEGEIAKAYFYRALQYLCFVAFFCVFSIKSVAFNPLLASHIASLGLIWILYYQKTSPKLPNIKILKNFIIDNWKLNMVWVTGYLYWNGPYQLFFFILPPSEYAAVAFSFNIFTTLASICGIYVTSQQITFASFIKQGNSARVLPLYTRHLIIALIAYCIFVIAFILIKQKFELQALAKLDFSYTFLLFLGMANIVFLSAPTVGRLFDREPYFKIGLLNNIMFLPILLVAFNMADRIYTSTLVIAYLFFVSFRVIKITRNVANEG